VENVIYHIFGAPKRQRRQRHRLSSSMNTQSQQTQPAHVHMWSDISAE